MKSSLNEDQREISEDIVSHCHKIMKSPRSFKLYDKMFSITGSGGTGKSYLTSILIEELSKNFAIRVTTPTHKALKVLKDMVANTEAQVQSSTIHSFLQLRVKENYDEGIIELKQEDTHKIEPVDILIVDESSMIGKKLYQFIEEAILSEIAYVVIFIGDKFQIPPVLDEPSGIYTNEDIKQYELLKIVRQAEGNPIIQFATEIRDCIKSKKYITNLEILDRVKYYTSTYKEIELYNKEKEFIERYFNTSYKHSDNLLVAYTNKWVDAMNKRIRQTLFPNTENYIQGERLIFNQTHSQGESIIHQNNEEIKIQHLEKRYDEDLAITFWDIIDELERRVKIVDIDSWQDFDYECDMIAREAKATKLVSARTNLWRRFFEIKNIYQKLSYTYACTCHKSQGSSVDECFIHLREILSFRDKIGEEDMFKLLYVAITRARHNVIFYV